MAQTRNMTRSKKQLSHSKKQLYRSRVKSSQCRKKSSSKCRRLNECKVTRKGRRQSYCRKKTNKHI
jgi:hypothetical protein